MNINADTISILGQKTMKFQSVLYTFIIFQGESQKIIF